MDDDLKAAKWNKIHLQENQYENRFRSKARPKWHLLLMNEKERTKEFKKNQLSYQENDLSHTSVTCPGKEGVASNINLGSKRIS